MPTRLGRRSAPASTLPTSPRRRRLPTGIGRCATALHTGFGRCVAVLRTGVGRYAAAIRVTGAVRYYAASLPIRLGAAMLSLGVLVLIRHATGGYATAGAVVGTLAVAGTVGGPLAARLTDRYGPRRVLPPLVAGNALGVVCLVVAVATAAPPPLWYATAAVAGLCTPAAGSLTRARWSALTPDRAVLSTGFALESLTDDLTFVVGPVLATVLGSTVQPVLAPLLTALLVLTGGVAMAVQRPPRPTAGRSGSPARAPSSRTAAPEAPTSATSAPATPSATSGVSAPTTPTGVPAPTAVSGPPAPPAMGGRPTPTAVGGALACGTRGRSVSSDPGRRRRFRRGAAGALAVPALRVMAGAFVATGVVFSGVQVSIAAVTGGYGHAAAAGPVYGCFGVASMCAGLGYGAIGWRSAPYRRVAVGFGCLAAGCALLPFVPGLGLLAAAVAVPGLAVAPTVIAGNTVVEQRVGAGQLAEAFAWLGGACSLGVAVGAAAAGRLVDAYGPRAGFLLPVLAAAAAALLVARSRRTLDPHRPDPSAGRGGRGIRPGRR